jgi:hypothetical protein
MLFATLAQPEGRRLYQAAILVVAFAGVATAAAAA